MESADQRGFWPGDVPGRVHAGLLAALVLGIDASADTDTQAINASMPSPPFTDSGSRPLTHA